MPHSLLRSYQCPDRPSTVHLAACPVDGQLYRTHPPIALALRPPRLLVPPSNAWAFPVIKRLLVSREKGLTKGRRWATICLR